MGEVKGGFQSFDSARRGDGPKAGDVDVRMAATGDLQTCAGLSALVSDIDHADWLQILGRDIGDPDRLLTVTTAHQRVVGYGRAGLFQPPQDAPRNAAPAGFYLFGLVVHPDHRRQGLGRALTTYRLTWLGSRTGQVWYFADLDNPVSIALHESLGFHRVTTDFWFPGLIDGTASHVLSRLDLPNPTD